MSEDMNNNVTENEEVTEEPKEKQEAEADPFVQLRELCKGTLTLMVPMRAASRDITELNYDSAR